MIVSGARKKKAQKGRERFAKIITESTKTNGDPDDCDIADGEKISLDPAFANAHFLSSVRQIIIAASADSFFRYASNTGTSASRPDTVYIFVVYNRHHAATRRPRRRHAPTDPHEYVNKVVSFHRHNLFVGKKAGPTKLLVLPALKIETYSIRTDFESTGKFSPF